MDMCCKFAGRRQFNGYPGAARKILPLRRLGERFPLYRYGQQIPGPPPRDLLRPRAFQTAGNYLPDQLRQPGIANSSVVIGQQLADHHLYGL